MFSSNLSYSIWGIFEFKNKIFLESIRKDLNKNLKGPKFPIHFTISSNVIGKKKDILLKLKKISKKNNSFFIISDGYGIKKKFFQSIFIKIKLTKEIIKEKKIIDNYFKIKKKEYYPHISLYYGLPSSRQKKKIISNLKKNKNKKLKIKKICLAQNDEKNLKWKIIKCFKI